MPMKWWHHVSTHRVVLKGGHVGLDCALHVAGSHQGCGQVYVAIDEVWLEPDGVSVVVQRLLKLAPLFEHVAKIGVGLGQHRVLFDGQSGEMSWPGNEDQFSLRYEDDVQDSLVISPALKVYGAQKKENPRVGWVLSPKLHRMFFCIFIITSLKHGCSFSLNTFLVAFLPGTRYEPAPLVQWRSRFDAGC